MTSEREMMGKEKPALRMNKQNELKARIGCLQWCMPYLPDGVQQGIEAKAAQKRLDSFLTLRGNDVSNLNDDDKKLYQWLKDDFEQKDRAAQESKKNHRVFFELREALKNELKVQSLPEVLENSENGPAALAQKP